jgi:2-C-methyl-D-erythritol 4-phosphate cytidylyltransferase
MSNDWRWQLSHGVHSGEAAAREFGGDPGALAEAEAGFPVRIISGDPLNIKVTTKDDLLLAEAILKSRRHS